jgi:hypothetical protein
MISKSRLQCFKELVTILRRADIAELRLEIQSKNITTGYFK